MFSGSTLFLTFNRWLLLKLRTLVLVSFLYLLVSHAHGTLCQVTFLMIHSHYSHIHCQHFFLCYSTVNTGFQTSFCRIMTTFWCICCYHIIKGFYIFGGTTRCYFSALFAKNTEYSLKILLKCFPTEVCYIWKTPVFVCIWISDVTTPCFGTLSMVSKSMRYNMLQCTTTSSTFSLHI